MNCDVKVTYIINIESTISRTRVGAIAIACEHKRARPPLKRLLVLPERVVLRVAWAGEEVVGVAWRRDVNAEQVAEILRRERV